MHARITALFNKISIHAPYKRVRLVVLSQRFIDHRISIHAPYKRVRPLARCARVIKTHISIHAPYKRVRRLAVGLTINTRHFNPRTLQESTTNMAFDDLAFVKISIHAPYKRVRLDLLKEHRFHELFQSTHPTRECDPEVRLDLKPRYHFNPRTLQESATHVG